MIAQLGIESVHLLRQIHALTLELGRQVAGQHGGHHRVLVPGIGALEVAAALLKAKDETVLLAFFLQSEDLAADVLKACQDRLYLYAVFRRNLVRQRRGDDAAHCNRRLRQLALGGQFAQYVIQQQAAQFIARQLTEAAVLGNGNGHAVTVRVRAQNQVRMGVDGDLIAFVQRRVRLRVGIFAGLEIAVGLLLDLDHIHIDADAAQHLADGLVAGAAERRIEQIQVVRGRRGNALLQNGLIVAFPKLRCDEFHRLRLQQLIKALLGGDKIRDCGDLTEHDGSRFVGHLAAVGAVALDAVVGTCVVAGGNNDAAAAL